jgi:hypothetical protein
MFFLQDFSLLFLCHLDGSLHVPEHTALSINDVGRLTFQPFVLGIT